MGDVYIDFADDGVDYRNAGDKTSYGGIYS